MRLGKEIKYEQSVLISLPNLFTSSPLTARDCHGAGLS